MRPLRSIVDGDGRVLSGIMSSGYIDDIVLAAGVAQTITAPTGARYVSFGASGDYYVNQSGTATIPGTTITGGTGSLKKPPLMSLDAATFSLISVGGDIISLAWYS
jgi:hypothetical protein